MEQEIIKRLKYDTSADLLSLFRLDSNRSGMPPEVSIKYTYPLRLIKSTIAEKKKQ